MLRRSPASGWNRALSLEALHLDKNASILWEEYLAVESDADWIAEAREHIRGLQRRGGDLCSDVEDGATRHDVDAVVRSLANCSDRVRVLGEEVLLAQWATATHEARGQDAIRALNDASTLATALDRTTGERLLFNSVRAIENASLTGRRGLVKAHLLYAEARTAYGKQSMTEALERFTAAETAMRANNSEFAARACMYAAVARYHIGQPAAARTQLTRCAGMPFESLALKGDIEWSRGLVDAASGYASSAVIAYLAALDSFKRANETENVAALHTQIAILYMVIGQNRDAWRHRERALGLNSKKELSRRRVQILLMDVARAASADGCPLAAIEIQNTIVDLARAGRQEDFIVNALQYRAKYFADAGLLTAAQTDLTEAEAILPQIIESAIRERVAANVKMTRAHAARAANPGAAVKLLKTTINDLRRVDARLLLPDLYVELARSYADQRQFPAAMHAIEDAVGELAFLNAKVGVWDMRRAHLDGQRRVREAGLQIFIEQRAYDRALEFAEQFDGQLREGSHSVTKRRLPSDTAIVKYGMTTDHLLIWIIAEARVTSFVVNVSAKALRASLETIEDDCKEGGEDGCRKALASLYAHVIAPVRAILPARLVIVPDDFLAAVPFAALYDGVAKRYLIEDHAVVISRCSTCTDVGAQFDARISGGFSRPLAIGNPLPIDRVLANLPFAEKEAKDVARRYAETELLLTRHATKERFLASCTQSDLIHYAGHGEANFDNPELSVLFLAMTDHDTGRLAVDEIVRIDLRDVRLVVLSACRSNVGRFSAQGALSLADAFIRAGARSVVATLWDTDDRAAERLLSAFHGYLQHGSTPAEALRSAQIAMLTRGDGLNSVLTWAAYQVVC